MFTTQLPKPAPFIPPKVSFSTDLVAESDRVGFFKEELARMLRLDVELLDNDLPKYEMSSIAAGPVAISTLEGSPTRVSRTASHLGDGDNGFLLTMQTSHRQNIAHNGREITLGAR